MAEHDDLFNDALELPRERRSAFLDEACGNDDPLRADVESLLELAEQRPELLKFPGPDSIPVRFGRYRVLDRCGEGGMGVVYQAVDPEIDFVVAIKVLSTSRFPTPDASRWLSRARQKLAQEARCLARLKHPSIAQIYALEYEDGVPYLVMEFVQGKRLDDLIEEGGLPIEERLRICREIGSGLHAAHEQGVVHRDLKPGNVMVSDRGEAKILDFGIAKVMEISQSAASDREEDETGALDGDADNDGVLRQARKGSPDPGPTQGTLLAGTPGYMSPEQESGMPVDHRTDIWAFGRLSAELLGLPVPKRASRTGGSLLGIGALPDA